MHLPVEILLLLVKTKHWNKLKTFNPQCMAQDSYCVELVTNYAHSDTSIRSQMYSTDDDNVYSYIFIVADVLTPNNLGKYGVKLEEIGCFFI